MSWYWWALIYVAGALVVFRTAFLRELDDYQRAVHKWKMTPSYGRMRSMATIEADHKLGLILVGLIATFWPVTVVCMVMYVLSRGIFWAMFPRGVKTKFDREQQLEQEKRDTEKKYQEAKELLAREGIKVE